MRGLVASVVSLGMLLAACGVVQAHDGGDPQFRSLVGSIKPAARGLDVRVLDYDDRLELRNDGERTVVIEGYNGEPYVRIDPAGRVQVNERSPALYLNEDRFANVDIPVRADEDAPPRWRTEDGSGRFEWHDHRMHWMGKGRPQKVSDPDVRTEVFDWKVPIRVGGERGTVSGRLLWVPLPSEGPPAAAWFALVALAALGGVVGIRIRRRRRVGPTAGEVW